MKEKIKIAIPGDYRNCGVSVDNNFICDNNCAKNFQKFVCPLPEVEGKWEIKSYEEFANERILTLIKVHIR